MFIGSTLGEKFKLRGVGNCSEYIAYCSEIESPLIDRGEETFVKDIMAIGVSSERSR